MASRRSKPKTKIPPALSPAISRDAENAAAILAFRDLVNNRLAREPYPPGYVVSTRWQEMVNRDMDAIASMEAKEIARFALMSAGFDVGLPLADTHYLIKSHARRVAAYPELAKISESPLAPSQSTAMCEPGITFSHGIEQSFDFYEYITAGVGREPIEHVLEIGSGCGRLARVLRLSGRVRRFTLVDLPQSLVFSFAFLRLHFPDATMKVISSLTELYPGMERDFDFIFCPVQFLAALRPGKVDLVINTYSFGEMQQGCVNHIMDCIHGTLRPRYLFSVNTIFVDKNSYFAESGGTGEGNEIVLRLEPTWLPKTFHLANDNMESGIWRSTLSTVLQYTTLPEEKLIADLIEAATREKRGTDTWLGYMFLAALWTLDLKVITNFLEGLRARHSSDGFDKSIRYRFEAIGEVQFLRRRASEILCSTKLIERERHKAQWSIKDYAKS